jgi:hypothetical protein
MKPASKSLKIKKQNAVYIGLFIIIYGLPIFFEAQWVREWIETEVARRMMTMATNR